MQLQEAIQDLQDTVKEGPTEALEAFTTHEVCNRRCVVHLRLFPLTKIIV